MPGDRLKLRALIEGYEVPCVSCYVNAAVNNGPAAATVQIVALTSSMYIAPNSLIRVYYLDTASMRSPFPGEPSVEDLYTQDQPIGAYRRLFTGKITGFSYRRAGNEKALVLQCLDDSSLWQVTTNMTGGKDAATTVSDEFTDAITLGNAQKGWASKMQSIMDEGAGGVKVAQDFVGIKGALGAMINLLLSAGGIFPPATNPGVEARRGDNQWSTFEELRTHLAMQLGTDDGVSASTVFVWDKMKKALFGGGGGVAGGKQSVSFYDIAQFICQQIFYNMSPQPCPYYSPYDGSGIDSISYPLTNYKNPGLAPIYAQLQEISNRLIATVNNMDARLTVSTLVSTNYTNASQFRAMDINYGALLLRDLGNSIDGMLTYLNGLGSATDAGVVSALASKLGTIKNDAKYAYDTFQLQGEYNAAGSKSTSADYDANFDFYWDDLNLAITKIATTMQELLAGAQIDTTAGSVSVNSKGRLLTQIILPDIWMCAPPTCNVIFQDEYEAFDMARNFLEEATKVIVTVSNSGGGGGDEFLSAITLGASGGGSSEFTVGTIQAWERFSGPIIKRVAVPSMFALDGSTAKGYGQMVANYLFYHLRFASRTAQVRTKFLPRLVLGAPGAILVGRIPSSWVVPMTAVGTPDVLTTVEDAVNALLDRGLRPPSQILGMISGLSHSCSQYDARTTVDINHARASHPDDEYLVSGPEDTNVEVPVSTQITYDDAMTEWRAGNSEKLDMLRAVSPSSITSVLKNAYALPYVSALFATMPAAKDLQSTALSTKADQNEGPNSNITVQSLQSKLEYGGQPSEISGTSLDKVLTGLMVPTLQTQNVITFLQTMGDAESILSDKLALPTIKSWTIKNSPAFLKKGPAGGNVQDLGIIVHGEKPEMVPDPSNPAVLLFKKVTIVEDVLITPFAGKGSSVEDKLMPSWIQGTYNNASISAVYQKLFGCKAITDPTVIGGDVPKSTETGVAGTQEAALDGLSFYYDRVKRISDAAAMEFIESYTFRPIATMRDCEGFNTYLNPDTGLVETPAVGTGINSSLTLDEQAAKGGIVGFYQGSSGIDYTGLKGLLGADGAGLIGTPIRAFHKAGDKVKIDETLDTRKERAQRVEYIIRELRSFSGGIVD
jgi:hypothetical protein